MTVVNALDEWLTPARVVAGAAVAVVVVFTTTAYRLRMASLRQHLDAAARREQHLLTKVDWQKTQLDAALLLAPELGDEHARRLTLIVTETQPGPVPSRVPSWWPR